MKKTIFTCPKCDNKLEINIPQDKKIKFSCNSCQQGYYSINGTITMELPHNSIEHNETSEQDSSPVVDKEESGGCFSAIIILFITLIIVLPLYIILNNNIPDFDWKWNLDRVLLGSLLFIIIRAIIDSLKYLAIIIFLVMVGWLGYGTYKGNYGYKEIYHDYISMIYSISNKPKSESIIFDNKQSFIHKNQILTAIDYKNSDVRTWAVQSATKHFKNEQNDYSQYKTIIQCFSIFKEINQNWQYVYDPIGEEYFAKASESIKTLAGDCDDHAILMAACIKAIGGKARLVHSQNNTEGHLYPELLIGKKKDLDNINYLIRKETFGIDNYDIKSNYYINEEGQLEYGRNATPSNKLIHYHTDDNGDIWLNMDYSENYPGGKFLIDNIIGILNI